MIKSSIEQNDKLYTYPILKRYVKGDVFIVLFTKARTGMVVQSSNTLRPIGDRQETWAEEDFTLFNGTITLTNAR